MILTQISQVFAVIMIAFIIASFADFDNFLSQASRLLVCQILRRRLLSWRQIIILHGLLLGWYVLGSKWVHWHLMIRSDFVIVVLDNLSALIL